MRGLPEASGSDWRSESADSCSRPKAAMGRMANLTGHAWPIASGAKPRKVLLEMKRFAIIAAVIAVVSGVMLQGTFGHWILIISVGLFLGAPLVLFMALWFLIGLKRTGGIPSGLRNTFLSAVIAGVALLLSIGTGTAIHHWQIHEARAYVAEMVPLLDGYREKHGRYPDTLAALAAPDPPALMQDSYSCSEKSDFFRFEYWDEAGIMAGYYFDSSSREWTYFD